MFFTIADFGGDDRDDGSGPGGLPRLVHDHWWALMLMSERRHRDMPARLDLTRVLVEQRFVSTHDHFAVANLLAILAHRQTNGRLDFNIPFQRHNGWVFADPLYAECAQSNGTTSLLGWDGKVFLFRHVLSGCQRSGSRWTDRLQHQWTLEISRRQVSFVER